MLRINSFLAVLSFSALQLAGQPQFELSRNVYRVPYSNGITVTVNNDHYTHDPLGRYDLKGSGFGGSCGVAYPIVAAAEGIIRRIVDNNNVHGPDCSSNCTQYNNYVWIEHANGEWTKYSHMKYQSTTIDAGLSVGDQVCAGTFWAMNVILAKPLAPIFILRSGIPMIRQMCRYLLPVDLCQTQITGSLSSIQYQNITFLMVIAGQPQVLRLVHQQTLL